MSGNGSAPDTEDARAEHSKPVPLLSLEGVSAGYNQFRALFDVSIEIQAGRATALVGPNGAGKTTVARVATGLVEPTTGTLRVDGEDVTGQPPHEIARRGIAHAPEGRAIFSSLSVEENLALSFRQLFGRAGTKSALDRAFELFPVLGRRRDQTAGSLSGGEQRMLTLGRVLVAEPRLLIADELSLGLAPVITTEVYMVLERIRDAGTALLVVEQHIDHALALADQIVALDRGSVTFRGRPDEIDENVSYFLTHPSEADVTHPAPGEPDATRDAPSTD
ncbi:MAG TPA: ABC transporter ATP-binding protein [Microthrixaceae bacterium]|nr:ABC transporter ATP-binding protein [Microthrixaceae bacterium]